MKHLTVIRLADNILFLLVIHFFCFTTSALAQKNNGINKFKLYSDPIHKFSFQIPADWEIIASDELPALAFSTTLLNGKKVLNETEEFSIEIYGAVSCDSAFLTRQGLENFFPGFTKNWNSEQGVTPSGDLYFVTYTYDPKMNPQWINNKPVIIATRDTIDISTILFTDTLFSISGTGWKGYWSKDNCSPVTSGNEIPRGDICEILYFYNGKNNVVRIATNGIAMDDAVRNKILGSFAFH